MEDGGPCYSARQRTRAAALHRETLTALQIVLQTATTSPGTYRRDGRAWVKVEG